MFLDSRTWAGRQTRVHPSQNVSLSRASFPSRCHTENRKVKWWLMILIPQLTLLKKLPAHGFIICMLPASWEDKYHDVPPLNRFSSKHGRCIVVERFDLCLSTLHSSNNLQASPNIALFQRVEVRTGQRALIPLFLIVFSTFFDWMSRFLYLCSFIELTPMFGINFVWIAAVEVFYFIIFTLLWTCFVDLEKAYDSVRRGILWGALGNVRSEDRCYKPPSP